MARFGVSATARLAPSFYNTESELEATETALRRIIDVFG
jgi:selenocysteine lyase/cysteine desulfurase